MVRFSAGLIGKRFGDHCVAQLSWLASGREDGLGVRLLIAFEQGAIRLADVLPQLDTH